MKTPNVLLVAMPWQRADAPSLQLGTLKAHCIRAGIKVKTLHAAPLLESKMGKAPYWRMANNIHPLLAEACFASMRRHDFPHADFMERLESSEEFAPGELDRIGVAVQQFCSDLYGEAPWKGYDVVGFSCTFNQLQASLWAAEAARQSGCITVLGGFLAQGGMGTELLQNICIDAVIDGPGELAFVEWLRQGCPAGVFTAQAGLPAPLVPEYDDYFADIPRHAHPQTCLLLEASRGCEHGACAFCSQNVHKGRHVYHKAYVDECLTLFAARYPFCREAEFADTSFPAHLLKTALKNSVLGPAKESWRLFAESRCLRPHEMRAAARAGFSSLQVGVESLHSGILRRMKKGASLLENICCLRESWNHGLCLRYNIILDMPGTTEAELAEMLRLLPLLHHLPPPTALLCFQLQRNSAVFRNPLRYGVVEIRPHAHHALLGEGHPVFYYDFSNTRGLSVALLEEAHAAFKKWEFAYNEKQPLCSVHFQRDRIFVLDSRPARLVLDSGPYALCREAGNILKACRNPQSGLALRAMAGKNFAALRDELTGLGLLLEEDDRYVALPVMAWNEGRIPPQPKRDPVDSFFSPDRHTEKNRPGYHAH